MLFSVNFLVRNLMRKIQFQCPSFTATLATTLPETFTYKAAIYFLVSNYYLFFYWRDCFSITNSNNLIQFIHDDSIETLGTVCERFRFESIHSTRIIPLYGGYCRSTHFGRLTIFFSNLYTYLYDIFLPTQKFNCVNVFVSPQFFLSIKS